MLASAIRLLWVFALLASGPVVGDQDAKARSENQGFLFGRVTSESGNEYTGFLRWGTEEAFWDDLFHSTKEDLPYWEMVDDEDWDRDRGKGRKRRRIKIFNWDFNMEDDDWDASRIFIARFGDIAEIRPAGDSEADVKMKNGETYEVSGYANDVSCKIHVNDKDLGEIDLRWKRIDTIEFMPAPRGEDPGVRRLYGEIETDAGDFKGFIQWDKEECVETDLLDGETEDGDISIQMGRISSIERRGRRSSIVTLKDGRELRMRGTNDVNSENRGIMVEDPRYGRVTVSWGAFEILTFADPPGSGRGFDEYKDQGELKGTVTDDSGDQFRGRIVFDLDEAEGWEILNGSYRDVEFDIPFNRIESIEPLDSDESVIVLKNGEKLTLEDSQDVTDRNDGVLVFTDKDRDPQYLEWDEVEMIQFK